MAPARQSADTHSQTTSQAHTKVGTLGLHPTPVLPPTPPTPPNTLSRAHTRTTQSFSHGCLDNITDTVTMSYTDKVKAQRHYSGVIQTQRQCPVHFLPNLHPKSHPSAHAGQGTHGIPPTCTPLCLPPPSPICFLISQASLTPSASGLEKGQQENNSPPFPPGSLQAPLPGST